MLSKQSNLKKGEAKIGFRFSQDGRQWEVTILNFSGFNAKTVDKLRPHLTASFSYKK